MILGSFKEVLGLLLPRQRFAAAELLFLLAVGAAFEMFSVAMVLPILAIGAAPDLDSAGPWARRLSEILGNPDRPSLIIVLMAIVTGIYLIKSIFLVYSQWRQARFVCDLDLSVSTRLFETYLRQEWDFHTQRNSAELVQNATSAVTELRLAAAAQIALLAECLTMLVLAGLLAVVSPLALLSIGLLVAVFGTAFQWIARDRVRRWGQIREQEHNARNKALLEGLGSAKEIKLYARENHFLERLSAAIVGLSRASKRYLVVIALPRLTLEFAAVAALSITVTVMLSLDWSVEAVVPIIGLFAVAAMRVLPSINRIITSLQQINFATPAIETLSRECRLPVTAKASDPVGSPRLKGDIVFDRVAYRYPGTEHLVLHDLSMRIQAGTTVAFIGASGAGKSTVIDLMLGLIRPSSGSILVDGRDIVREESPWKSQVGYVPQMICLTDDSLRDNIAFGIPPKDVDESAIVRAVRAAQLEHFVASLPDGLDTRVGERGVRLSGGQRQRIGIARALYGDPSLLVLDEATSALDVETERQVMESINRLRGTRTIVIVTHRMSTIEGVDTVFRLSPGRLEVLHPR
jgi:ABC-type multidrug transport system fused ATPase/permease subunit